MFPPRVVAFGTMFDSADAYDRFMGRYSGLLAAAFSDYAMVKGGMRVLDVGSGPGALTKELTERNTSVTAVDPSQAFVDAVQARHPEVEAFLASAEDLPFGDDSFDASLAQLVVHFMSDPVTGLGEMKRVTRPGGVVAACVWDLGGDRSPLSPFWEAVRELDPGVPDETERPGTGQGHLGELFVAAGIVDVDETALRVDLVHPDFEDWWEPYTLAVGPAGVYLAGLEPDRRRELRELCRSRWADGAFSITCWAWAARGYAQFLMVRH